MADTPSILSNDPLQVKPLLAEAWNDYDRRQSGRETTPGLTSASDFVDEHATLVMGMTPEEFRARVRDDNTGLDLEGLVEEVRQGKKPIVALKEARERGVAYLSPVARIAQQRQEDLKRTQEHVRATAAARGRALPESVEPLQLELSDETSGLLTYAPFIGDGDKRDAKVVMPGEIKAHKYLAELAELEREDPEILSKINKWSEEELGPTQYLKYRQRKEVKAKGWDPGNLSNEQEAWVKAQKPRHLRELGMWRMKGRWTGPMLLNMNELDPDYTEDSPYLSRLYDAAVSPVVDIVGLDKNNKLVLRQASAPRHAFDVFATPEAAASPVARERLDRAYKAVDEAGLPSVAALPLAAWGMTVPGLLAKPPEIDKEDVLTSVATRDNFMEAALHSDLAQTSQAAKIGMGVLGFAASVGAPDLTLGIGPTARAVGRGTRFVGKVRAANAVKLAHDARAAGDLVKAQEAEAVLRKRYPHLAQNVDIEDARLADLYEDRSPGVLGKREQALRDRLPEDLANSATAAHPVARKALSQKGPKKGPQIQTGNKRELYHTQEKLGRVAEVRARAENKDPTLLAHRIKPQMLKPLGELDRVLDAAELSAADRAALQQRLLDSRKELLRDPEAWAEKYRAEVNAQLPKKASAGVRSQAHTLITRIQKMAERTVKKEAEWAKLEKALDDAEEAIQFSNNTRAKALANVYLMVRGKNLDKRPYGLGKDREDMSAAAVATARKLSELMDISQDQADAIVRPMTLEAATFMRQTGRPEKVFWRERIGKIIKMKAEREAPSAPPAPKGPEPDGPTPTPPSPTPEAPLPEAPLPAVAPEPPVRDPSVRLTPQPLRLQDAAPAVARAVEEGAVPPVRARPGEEQLPALPELMDTTPEVPARAAPVEDSRVVFVPDSRKEAFQKALDEIDPFLPAGRERPRFVTTDGVRYVFSTGSDQVLPPEVVGVIERLAEAPVRRTESPRGLVAVHFNDSKFTPPEWRGEGLAPRFSVYAPWGMRQQLLDKAADLQRVVGVRVSDVSAGPALLNKENKTRPNFSMGIEPVPTGKGKAKQAAAAQAARDERIEGLAQELRQAGFTAEKRGGFWHFEGNLHAEVPPSTLAVTPAPVVARRRPSRRTRVSRELFRDKRVQTVPDSRKADFAALADEIEALPAMKGVKVFFDTAEGTQYTARFENAAGTPVTKSLPSDVVDAIKRMDGVGSRVSSMGMGSAPRTIRFTDTSFTPPLWEGAGPAPSFGVYVPWYHRPNLLGKAKAINELLGTTVTKIDGGTESAQFYLPYGTQRSPQADSARKALNDAIEANREALEALGLKLSKTPGEYRLSVVFPRVREGVALTDQLKGARQAEFPRGMTKQEYEAECQRLVAEAEGRLFADIPRMAAHTGSPLRSGYLVWGMSMDEAEFAIARGQIEYGAVYDSDGAMMALIEGAAHELRVNEPTGDFMRNAPGRMWLTHNHPNGSFFSLKGGDVAFATSAGLRGVRAVQPNGTTYVLEFFEYNKYDIYRKEVWDEYVGAGASYSPQGRFDGLMDQLPTEADVLDVLESANIPKEERHLAYAREKAKQLERVFRQAGIRAEIRLEARLGEVLEVFASGRRMVGDAGRAAEASAAARRAGAKGLAQPEEVAPLPAKLSSKEIARRIEEAGAPSRVEIEGILGPDMPKYLDGVVEHILDRRETILKGEVTRRDLAKAYVMTVMSQGSSIQPLSTVLPNTRRAGIPDELVLRYSEGTVKGERGIRPEEASAAWLMSPNGQRALDALDHGVMDQEAWLSLAEARRSYGRTDLYTQKYLMGPKGMGDIERFDQVLDVMNTAGKEGDVDAVVEAATQLAGIELAKKGFLTHFIGVGHVPTIDAREINLWVAGVGDLRKATDLEKAELARRAKQRANAKNPVGKVLSKLITERIGELAAERGLDPAVGGHLIHHLLWDRISNSVTTHHGLYETMRLASGPSWAAGVEGWDDVEAAAKAWQELGTDSPWFKRWFGDSKVVGEDGKPLVVYHGTSADFDEFDPAQGISSRATTEYGVYTTPRVRYAQQYGRKTMPLYLSLKNPLIVEGKYEISPRDLTRADIEKLKGEGYDGIAVVNRTPTYADEYPPTGPFQPIHMASEIVAFDPEQIKSATGNVGTFDPRQASILRAGADVAGISSADEISEARRLWQEQGTDSPYFQKWFGASEIVDEAGKPQVMYHGTSADFDSFRAGGPQVGSAIFVSEQPKWAAEHARAAGGSVMPVYVRANRVWDYRDSKALDDYADYLGVSRKEVDEWGEYEDASSSFLAAERGQWDFIEGDEFQQYIRDRGYDAFWLKENPRDEGTRGLGVRDPEQVKSATGNRGTFGPTANILRAGPDVFAPGPVYFSQLRRELEATKSNKLSPDQWKGYLAKRVKKDELVWTGINEFLDARKAAGARTVTKEELLRHFDSNEVKVEVVYKGIESSGDAAGLVRVLDREFDLPVGMDHEILGAATRAAGDYSEFLDLASAVLGRALSPSSRALRDLVQKYDDEGLQALIDAIEVAPTLSAREKVGLPIALTTGSVRGLRLSSIKKLYEIAGEPLNLPVSKLPDADLLPPKEVARRKLVELRAELEPMLPRRGSAGTTQWSAYAAPGGSNYRELLLTTPAETRRAYQVRRSDHSLVRNFDSEEEAKSALDWLTEDEMEDLYVVPVDTPTSSAYQGPHWEEPNVLAHLRLTERTTPDGKRVLFLEELQSDWHQLGRKHGRVTPEAEADLRRAEAKRDEVAEQLGRRLLDLDVLQVEPGRTPPGWSPWGQHFRVKLVGRDPEMDAYHEGLVRDSFGGMPDEDEWFDQLQMVTQRTDDGVLVKFEGPQDVLDAFLRKYTEFIDDSLREDGLSPFEVINETTVLVPMSPGLTPIRYGALRQYSGTSAWTFKGGHIPGSANKTIEEVLQDPHVLRKVGASAEAQDVAKFHAHNDSAARKTAEALEAVQAEVFAVQQRIDFNIPPGPFSENWHELALKRFLRIAADEGYDGVAVTRGDIITPMVTEGEEYVGQRADWLINYGYDRTYRRILEGNEAFYNKKVPAYLQKLGKKLGLKKSFEGVLNEELGAEAGSVPVFMFTDKSPAQIQRGFPLFQRDASVADAAQGRPARPAAPPKIEAKELARMVVRDVLSPDDFEYFNRSMPMVRRRIAKAVADFPGRSEDEIQRFGRKLRKQLHTVIRRERNPRFSWGEAREARRHLFTLIEAEAKKIRMAPPGKARARGAANIRRRLDMELRTRDDVAIPEEDLIELNNIIELLGEKRLEDMLFSLRKMGAGKLASFDMANDILTLSRRLIQGESTYRVPRVFTHEVWHAFSRRLPDELLENLHTQFVKERKAYQKRAPGYFNEKGELTRVHKGNYRYANFDEWIAENFADAVEKRMAVDKAARFGGVWDSLRLFWHKLVTYLNHKIGRNRVNQVLEDFLRGSFDDAPVLRASLEGRMAQRHPVGEALRTTREGLVAPRMTFRAGPDLPPPRATPAAPAAPTTPSAEPGVPGAPETEFVITEGMTVQEVTERLLERARRANADPIEQIVDTVLEARKRAQTGGILDEFVAELPLFAPEGARIPTFEELAAQLKATKAITVPGNIFPGQGVGTLQGDGQWRFTWQELEGLGEMLRNQRAAAKLPGMRAAYDSRAHSIWEQEPVEALKNLLEGQATVFGLDVKQPLRWIVGSMFGGDEWKELRVLPPVTRKAILAVPRVVEHAYGETIRFMREATTDEGQQRLYQYLSGEVVSFEGGRRATSSGVDCIGDLGMQLQRQLEAALDDNEQAALQRAMDLIREKKWSRMTDATVENHRSEATVVLKILGKVAGEKPPEDLSNFLDDAFRALAVSEVNPSDQTLAPLESLFYHLGVTRRKGELVTDNDSASSSYARIKGLVQELEGEVGIEGAMRVSVLVGGYGQAARGVGIWARTNVYVPEELMALYNDYVMGMPIPASRRAEVEALVKRMGMNARLTRMSSLDAPVMVPQIARKRLKEALARGNRFELPLNRLLGREDNLTLGWGTFYRYMKTRMTRGVFMIRQRYFFMNTMDHFGQMAMVNGFTAAAASTARVAAQNVLIFPGLRSSLYAAEKVGAVSPQQAERFRDRLQQGGDKAAQLVQTMMGAGKYRIEVNPILDGREGFFLVGGRVYSYQKVRQIAVESGIFSSFDTAALETGVRSTREAWLERVGKSPEIGSVGARTRDAVNDIMQMTADTAEAWAERERLGAMITLMEQGWSPKVAADMTVQALFDYAGSMTKYDRNVMVNLVFPFWAFQKNANRLLVDRLFSPWGAYRMSILRKAQERGTELLSYALYESVVDPYGVDTESMDPTTRNAYMAWRQAFEFGYGPMEAKGDWPGWPPEVKQQIINDLGPPNTWAEGVQYRLENGYGGPDKVPRMVLEGVRAQLLGKSTLIVDGEYYEMPYAARDAMKKSDIELFQRFVPPKADPSGRASHFRDRFGIALTPRMTEAVQRWYSAYKQQNPDMAKDYPYVEIYTPEPVIYAGMRHVASIAALTILSGSLATDAAAGIFQPADEREREQIDYEYGLGPSIEENLRQVADIENAPIPGTALALLGTSEPIPRRVHPWLTGITETVFPGLKLLRVPGHQDPFITSAEQERERQLNEAAKAVGELRPERYYLPPGGFSLAFENTPFLGELNQLFLTQFDPQRLARGEPPVPSPVLERLSGTQGTMAAAARAVLQMQTAIVERHRTARRDAPRTDTETTTPP